LPQSAIQISELVEFPECDVPHNPYSKNVVGSRREEDMIDWKQVEEQFERYAPQFLRYLANKRDEEISVLGENTTCYAEVAEPLAALALYKSSERLEQLNKVLVVLSFVLAVLTAILIWRTFT
jgi:hypothetical protein